MTLILDPEDDDLQADVGSAGELRHYDPRPSQELQQLTEEFLANGGHITYLAPTTVSKPLRTRKEEVAAEYNRRLQQKNDNYKKEAARRHAQMVIDDIPKVVAIREELARGTRGMQKVADAVGLHRLVVQRIANMYNLPVRLYRKQHTKRGISA